MNLISFNNFKYEKKEIKISLLILVIIFLFSFFSFIFSNPGKRYVVYFESVDSNNLSLEYRYLNGEKYPKDVVKYANEIVLGPKSEVSKFMFSSETYIISSFVRDDVLYINFSDDVLSRAGRCSEILRGIELFKMNILNSFSKINSVEMYIGNKSVNNSD